jgi:hypothetical protein
MRVHAAAPILVAGMLATALGAFPEATEGINLRRNARAI